MRGDDFPDLRPYIADIARAILGEPNKELSTSRQLRFGSRGSVAVEITGEKCGEWFDHEEGTGGGPWDMLVIKGRMTNGEAIEWLRQNGSVEIGRKKKTLGRIVAAYDYRNESGELLFQVCRYEPKDFRQRRPDQNGSWIWQVKGSRQVPYRLPELIASSADVPVYIVEGEKDADRLATLGLVATCNPGGAGKASGRAKSKSKWSPELNQFFSDRDVTIIPDNDDAGHDHARSIAANLTSVVARVRIFALPGVRPKGDISDWLDAGGSREESERLVADTPPFQLAQVPTIGEQANALDDTAEIARLAKLPLVAYGRERKLAAERLGCPLSMLDPAVAAERDNGGAPGQGRPLDLPEPEP
jgi:putative DNA primase/helicase